MEKEIQLDQIYELLDIEHSKTEKEWGWKKVLVRSIMYPLSIFFNRGFYFYSVAARGLLCSNWNINNCWVLPVFRLKNHS